MEVLDGLLDEDRTLVVVGDSHNIKGSHYNYHNEAIVAWSIGDIVGNKEFVHGLDREVGWQIWINNHTKRVECIFKIVVHVDFWKLKVSNRHWHKIWGFQRDLVAEGCTSLGSDLKTRGSCKCCRGWQRILVGEDVRPSTRGAQGTSPAPMRMDN